MSGDILLAIIRHGHTPWNREGRIQGRTDIPLAPDVIEDMAQYRLPASWQQARLVASPLSRAMQTAELVARRPPLSEPALIEMDWGEWEGLRSIDIGADPSSGFRHLEQWGWHYKAPQGESPSEVRARLQPWLDSLQQDTLAVCHIGVMRVLLATAHGWSFQGSAPFEIKRKRLYILRVGDRLEVADPPCVRLLRADTTGQQAE